MSDMFTFHAVLEPSRVDADEGLAGFRVTASKADIKAAPELDERRIRDRGYLETLDWHYRIGQPEGA